ncbi:hypothetical protein EVAR_84782_1 [Eumeta japonica]|uniref:Uncharacterized protein n=1 Tax=Eumeta variegata TaxID=151549 RepID=A0A4C1U9D9_EUMVA|nr:hypothetical protein EVAR_84782_1 [Eumeta japonica]
MFFVSFRGVLITPLSGKHKGISHIIRVDISISDKTRVSRHRRELDGAAHTSRDGRSRSSSPNACVGAALLGPTLLTSRAAAPLAYSKQALSLEAPLNSRSRLHYQRFPFGARAHRDLLARNLEVCQTTARHAIWRSFGSFRIRCREVNFANEQEEIALFAEEGGGRHPRGGAGRGGVAACLRRFRETSLSPTGNGCTRTFRGGCLSCRRRDTSTLLPAARREGRPLHKGLPEHPFHAIHLVKEKRLCEIPRMNLCRRDGGTCNTCLFRPHWHEPDVADDTHHIRPSTRSGPSRARPTHPTGSHSSSSFYLPPHRLHVETFRAPGAAWAESSR